jgi:hypothetical protein
VAANVPSADTQDYLGSQDAGTVGSDYNSREFHTRSIVEQSVRTGGPVKVIRAPYDANGNALTPGSNTPIGYIDVQPMVNQIDGYGNATPHGTVYRVTYYRYQNGLFAIYADPVVGDIGHMVPADRDVSSVYANNAVANPGSRRKFDLADGTYFGTSRGNAPQSYLVPQPDGSLNLVMPAGKTLTVTGNLHVSGAIIAGYGGGDQVGLQTHDHPQGPDSHGDTEENTGPPVPGS